MAVPRAVVPPVALAYGIAVLVVKPWAADPPTAYAGASTLAAAVGLVAGIGLLASGSALWLERGRDRAAVLLVLAGVAWFAPDWLGWDDGPSIVRSVAAVAAPFLSALLLDLVATVSGSRLARLSSNVLYASTVVVSVGRALFRDPFLDPRCWSNCTDNAFLVEANQRVARTLDSALPRVTLVDLKKETALPEEKGVPLFSRPLVERLAEVFARREQAILLQPRRGFAPFLLCRDCGFDFRCSRCSVCRTVHDRGRRIADLGRIQVVAHQDVPDAGPGEIAGQARRGGARLDRLLRAVEQVAHAAAAERHQVPLHPR